MKTARSLSVPANLLLLALSGCGEPESTATPGVGPGSLAEAFWSVTLYDLQHGFFIPDDRRKYSVGENAGMKLDKDGGIAIYIAAKKPEGVPVGNWLPIDRKDEDLSVNLRIYVPDEEKMKTWKSPQAQRITTGTDR